MGSYIYTLTALYISLALLFPSVALIQLFFSQSFIAKLLGKQTARNVNNYLSVLAFGTIVPPLKMGLLGVLSDFLR